MWQKAAPETCALAAPGSRPRGDPTCHFSWSTSNRHSCCGFRSLSRCEARPDFAASPGGAASISRRRSPRNLMRDERETAHRLATYSDAVFAVIVTLMVLELKAPEEPAFSALLPLWPTVISYAVSYLFITIIWINHHYLVRFLGPPTLGLIWINFVH